MVGSVLQLVQNLDASRVEPVPVLEAFAGQFGVMLFNRGSRSLPCQSARPDEVAWLVRYVHEHAAASS